MKDNKKDIKKPIDHFGLILIREFTIFTDNLTLIKTMKIKVVILFSILLGFACSNSPKSSDAVQAVTSIQAPDFQKMITARVFIKPGLENEFIETAKMMIENSNKEEGCLGYMLYQDPYEKTNFIFVEKYKNQAAIDTHFATAYFKEFGTKIADMTSKPTEIKIIDIAAEK
jgi:quinol monooxygenase YgiN